MRSYSISFARRHQYFIAFAALVHCYTLAASMEPAVGKPLNGDGPLKPVQFDEVTIADNFWRPRLVTLRETLLPFAFEQTLAGVRHLEAARDFRAGKKVEGHRPHPFVDSDLYKVMEGAAYLLQLQDDPEIERRMDGLVDLIEAAQMPDGYLYPSHITGVGKTAPEIMGKAPYTYEVHSHETYNMGHMYEAAIAYYQATGKDKFLRVAEKSAQHINQVFFAGDPNYNGGKPVNQAPGHPEIELALVKLYRATGKPLYLVMARRFLEIRGVTYRPEGEGILAPTYAQQHAPVLQQREPVGHAVRALYLYCGMADVGTLTGDSAYEAALHHIWQNIVDTRTHITGGLGAIHGIEGFGPPYELPNADAYDETCAAVASVLFNHRMFLLNKDAKYLDVAENALLNNALAGVNLAGNCFFYVNPLEADGKTPFNHGTPGRAPWFDCACCPSNIARLLPQVQGMTYAHNGRDIYVAFYAGSKTAINLDNAKVAIEQQTNYPEEETIRIAVTPDAPSQFRLLLRIPTWTRDRIIPSDLYEFVDKARHDVQLLVNGEPTELSIEKGFAVVDREWKAGDMIELTLPMPVRISRCHPDVKSNENRIAFSRGPLVLCAEGVDNDDGTTRFFFEELPDTASASVSRKVTPTGSFLQATIHAEALNADLSVEKAPLVLTPYYAWNNRGTSSMMVWFPRDHKLAKLSMLGTTSISIAEQSNEAEPL